MVTEFKQGFSNSFTYGDYYRKLLNFIHISLDNLSLEVNNIARFLKKARKFTDIKELTPELIRVFIERVDIYEKEVKFKHHQPRQIDIYYRDVGLIDVIIQNDVNKAIGIA